MIARFVPVALIVLSCEGSGTARNSQPTPLGPASGPAAPREDASPGPAAPGESTRPEPSARALAWLDAEPVAVATIGPKDSLTRREGECWFAPAFWCPPGSACNVPVPARVDCRTRPPAGKEGWFRFPAGLERESATVCRYQSETWCPPPTRGGACTPAFGVRLPCDREARFRWSGRCFVLDARACERPPCEGNVPRRTDCPG